MLMHRRRLVAAGAFAGLCLASASARAQDFALATNPAGITIGGAAPAWSTGFGAVNGLGLGTPGANQTVLPPSAGGGVLYSSPYNIVISGASGNHKAIVRAYVSANFVHTSVLQVYSCVASCTSGGSYAALSTSSLSPTDIIGAPGVLNQSFTRYLAVFVSNQNGASAYAGADSAVVSMNVYDAADNSLKHSYTLALTNPVETVQTALRLAVGTAAGGRTIAAASDYSLALGNVNGLGISPGAGLTATAATGGEVYSTPYLLQPTFSGFSSTTGSLKTYVSTDFAHPSQLELRDSSTGASFSAISKSSSTPTTLTSAASSGSSLTRYLGLFVSGANGSAIFTGTDSATVTFTLVVP